MKSRNQTASISPLIDERRNSVRIDIGLLCKILFSTAVIAIPSVRSAERNGVPPVQRVAQQSRDRGWTIEETMKVRMVGHVRIAPGGERVLYIVRTAILDGDKGRYRTQIYTANSDGTNQRALTGTDYSATSPEWSPDGRWIAFAADRSGRGDGNTLWIIPSLGGESRAVDVGGTEVSTLKWSPDGKWIAFTMPAPLTAAQAQARAHPMAPQVVDADIRNVQLWVIGIGNEGAARGPAHALTPESLSVRPDSGHGSPWEWAPDGLAIVFAHGGDMWDDWTRCGIATVDLATRETRSVVPSRATAPRYSPDGKRLAYIGGSGRLPLALDVFVIALPDGQALKLAETFGRFPTLLGWSSDGTRVYVHETRRTVTRITALPASGAAGVDVDPGDAVLGDVTLDARRELFGFTRQTLTEPMEVHVSKIGDFAPVRVSRVNAALPSAPLPRTEVVRWNSADGSGIEGLLTYPGGYEQGRRYPLVVAIHAGGRTFRQTFIANPFHGGVIDYYPITEFARHGFAVLQCNSRGGNLGGYGPDSRMPLARPKDRAYHDVMTGVDYVIGLGVADGARVGATGMSNGGFVTLWLMTQTPRFKAALINGAFAELSAMSGRHTFIPYDLGAELWEDGRPYQENSPWTHLGRVKTPMLILHGERDEPAPISSMYGLYRALKRLGVPTEMVMYPAEPHEVNAPKHLIDIGRRHVEWMTKHLK